MPSTSLEYVFSSPKPVPKISALSIISLTILFLLFMLPASAWAGNGPVPQITETVPEESFLGEQFCFTTEFTNSGATGFGPYLRLILPPELEFNSASAFGGGTVNFIGEFPDDPDPYVTETELTDPLIDEPVTGPEGYSYYNYESRHFCCTLLTARSEIL